MKSICSVTYYQKCQREYKKAASAYCAARRDWWVGMQAHDGTGSSKAERQNRMAHLIAKAADARFCVMAWRARITTLEPREGWGNRSRLPVIS